MELAKTEIKQKHAIPLSEDIADEIRTWFKEYHTTTGKFPDFPTEECGGSRHLLSRQGQRKISSENNNSMENNSLTGGKY